MLSRRENGILSLIAILLLCENPVSLAQSNSSPRASTANQTKGGPYSLDDVLGFLNAFKDKDASQDEVIQKISRGLIFEADPGTIATLQEHGATDEIIRAVEQYAKKEDPKGAIALSCYPPECKIAINGHGEGTTSEGHFKKGGLKVGQSYVVDCSRDGYFTEQPDILAAVDPVEKSISLKPTDQTQRQLGNKLYELVMPALGNNLTTLKSLTAKGSAKSYKNGKLVKWDFEVSTAPPHFTEMRVSNSMGSLDYMCNEHRCQQRKKGGFLGIGKGGSKLPSETVTELEVQLTQFWDYNLATILETFGSGKVKLKALTADKSAKSEQRLEAESRDTVYELVLGPDLVPISAEYKPRAGLGAATITYGSYDKLGKGLYPKHTIIALKGSTESGIDVQLDQVDLGSDLRPSDFPK